MKCWRIHPNLRHIRDQQRVFRGFQLRMEHPDILHNPDAPSLGIQDLLQYAGIFRVILKHKNANLPWEAVLKGIAMKEV